MSQDSSPLTLGAVFYDQFELLDIYGPKANLMVDYSRIEKLEAARRGFPPSQSLWGKVASLASDG